LLCRKVAGADQQLAESGFSGFLCRHWRRIIKSVR
jgi:hypothetical protein